MTSKAGQPIEDGDAVWIIDDVRDGARVGDIILRPTLRDGYIKANGATVKASEYPRLLAWVQESNMIVMAEQYKTDCSKYVYDRVADTLTLPDATGRVLMGGERAKSVEAGLPNITGELTYWGGTEFFGGGAFSGSGKHDQWGLNSNGVDKDNNSAFFDASRSNPIYGRSDTVQPPALSLIAQIKY